MRLLFMALKPTRGLINIFGKDVARLNHAEIPLCAAASVSCFRISACSTI